MRFRGPQGLRDRYGEGQGLQPKLRGLDGHHGAIVVSCTAGNAVEVRVLTFWDSMVSIGRFASKDPTEAVVEPEARALLEDFDARVKHYHVRVA
jgi:hypothetical protein